MRRLMLCWIVLTLSVFAEPLPPITSSDQIPLKLEPSGKVVVLSQEQPQTVELQPLKVRRIQPVAYPVYSEPFWWYPSPAWCPPMSDPTWRRFNTWDPWCGAAPFPGAYPGF